MAALGPHRWFLLCALATYMDENGIAYPKQDGLAEKLNVSTDAIKEWVKKLKDFRWNGQPIVTVEKAKADGKRKKNSSFPNNIYRISPQSQLSIFKG